MSSPDAHTHDDAPVLPAHSFRSITFLPSAPPHHPLQHPTVSALSSSITQVLSTASDHLHASRLIAFPTETVYGLAASSLDPEALAKVYKLKGRPPDNPLIIHVSSLDMLSTLLPPNYRLSPLYLALITTFWPGPLTLLCPSPSPPPPPAPQTIAIRLPSHPLARALIQYSNLPLSAPSANSSGRPSPTTAQHVAADLGRKPRDPETGEVVLGAIVDAGGCEVGLESTVVDGLGWDVEGGGVLKVLRPGGVGVEELREVVERVDEECGLAARGTRTTIWVHGQDTAPPSLSTTTPKQVNGISNPSTPGMKYKHYSPSIPVFLLLPSSSFPRPTASLSSLPSDVLDRIAALVTPTGKGPIKFGLMHFDASPLSASLTQQRQESSKWSIKPLNMGPTPADAARTLFSGLLTLEAKPLPGAPPVPNGGEGVDAILIEGCSNEGIGLAVMERAGKAVGGGGKGGLGTEGGAREGRFWVDVGGEGK